jgi:two-component system chemotaxis response regulator CheY
MRSLVVDDDHICRTLLQHILTPFGPVTYAVDGLGALAEVARSLAQDQPYDLITLDIMMPELDGQQTLKAIRRLEELFGCVRRSSVAMTSALDDKKNVMTAFREQAELYFIKPLRLEQVLADLRKAKLIPT